MKKVRSDPLFGDTFEHPSFGTITFNQAQGGKSPLFGSDIEHRNVIILRIKRAEYTRDTGADYIFGRDTLIEAYMSPTQFADAITGLSSGSGTPITFQFIKGEGKIEQPEFVNKREQFEAEFLKTAGGVMERLVELERKVVERKLPKWVSNEIDVIRGWLKSNIPFLAEQFDEQMDKSVTEAKGELEAYVSGMVNRLGLKEVRKQTPLLPEGKGDKNE